MEPEAASPAGLMRIKVKTLGNTVYDLEMKPEALIRDMKAKLEELSETPANLQRLVFRGHMLKDEQSLSHHNVTDGSTVHLVMRPVDTSQAPPAASGADRAHPFAGPMGGGFPIAFRGVPNGALNPNDFGQFIAGMLGSMGVQGAVQVMHTTIPMEWTPNMGGQGGQGRGRGGAQGPGSHGQAAADLAQRMSDQARSAGFHLSAQQHGSPAAQQSADGGQHSGHLFASIATWLSRLNDAGGSRSWPNIELPYPDSGGGVPGCSISEFAEAARAVWEMGGWAADEPASAFLQSSTEDVTFGRWLPEQVPEPEQAPPDRPAPEQGFDPLQMRPPAATGGAAEQRQELAQSGQSTAGPEQGPQQAQQLRAARQPQEAEQPPDSTGPPAQQQSHSVSIQMSGENPADLLAAITSALSNQERDSTDHLASGSASTGSMSSLVPPRSSEDTGVHAERDPRRNGMDNPFGAGYEPLHPQLALLTGYTLQRMLEETARHTQARVVPRMADICAALRRFLREHHADVLRGSPGATDTLQREALRAANMLHAEGVLLMEEARAAAAAILALRDNTPRPLMAAGPVFLHADGSRAFASSLRAGLGAGARAPPVTRPARAGRGGSQPGAPAGRAPGAQAGPGAGLPLPPGMLPQAFTAGVLPQPFAQFAMGGTPVRISHNNSQGGSHVTVQMGNAAAASMDMTPLVEAFESMMASVPQLQELFRVPPAAQPGWAAQAGQAGHAGQAPEHDASTATTAQLAGPAAEPPRTAAAGAQAARGAPAEAALDQRPSALRALALPVLQQAIPMLVSVLVSGQQARTGNPGPVVLEQQQTHEMHLPSFPSQAPPGAGPAQAANSAHGAPAAQQARTGTRAQAGAGAGGQQMRVPTFVVNAGQPNEMEVDIQADFSEGQTLPSQAAMQPLVAQIMRAVTGQAGPPARPAQQGPLPSAASQPLPAQQQQQPPRTAGAPGAGAAEGFASAEAPPGPRPEEQSDDSNWETASEESAEHSPREGTEGGPAERQHNRAEGDVSRGQHRGHADDAEKQRPDGRQPADEEVQSSSQGSRPVLATAAAASRPDMRKSLDSGLRSFPLTDSPESYSAPGSPQPAAPPGTYPPPQPQAQQRLQAPRGMGLALPGRPGADGRGGRSAGRGAAHPAAGAAASSRASPAASEGAAGSSTTVPQGLGRMGLPRPGGAAAASSLRAAVLPDTSEARIEEMQPPRSGGMSAGGMGGAMGGGGGLAGMMSQLMQSPAMQQMAGSLADRANTRGGPPQRAAPDFGSFLQDMMPVVGQMLGGLGQGGPSMGGGQRGSTGGGNMMRSSAGGDDFAALGELPPDQAALWRRRILADRVRQAEMETPDRLSEAYLSGSSNRQDSTGQGSSSLSGGFL